jgi:DMSO/TMAO reductase YedYZ heme-binding membrane subunit
VTALLAGLTAAAIGPAVGPVPAAVGPPDTGLLNGPLLWYLNRGTGVVLVAVLTGSCVLGVLATVRAGGVRWPRSATQALHRNLSLLATSLLAIHVLTAVIDTYVDIRWWEAMLPFLGEYRPFWLGLGAVAFDLTAAVVVTSLIRHRMNHRHWRMIHLASYPAWAIGVLHGIGIGTDTTTAWSAGVTIASVGAVTAAAVVRLSTWNHERRLAG